LSLIKNREKVSITTTTRHMFVLSPRGLFSLFSSGESFSHLCFYSFLSLLYREKERRHSERHIHTDRQNNHKGKQERIEGEIYIHDYYTQTRLFFFFLCREKATLSTLLLLLLPILHLSNHMLCERGEKRCGGSRSHIHSHIARSTTTHHHESYKYTYNNRRKRTRIARSLEISSFSLNDR
jgi:hypothetical protein